MIQRYALVSVLASILIASAAGCTGELSLVDGTTGGGTQDAATFFTQKVQPGVSGCPGCHSGAGPGPALFPAGTAGPALRTAILGSKLANGMDLVSLTAPATSILITYKHTAGADLNAAFAQPVQDWLALESPPAGP